MTMQEYIDNIKLELTGNILELEVEDETLAKVVERSLREVQRYIDSTEFMTIPYARCIDLNETNVSSVAKVFRSEGYVGSSDGEADDGSRLIGDPMYAQMWAAFSNGGTMYNLNDFIMNYLSYNTLLQMRNTTSTDLSFRHDKQQNKLYINISTAPPTLITLEYVPIMRKVEEIKSPYWEDILRRLSVAHTKVILGRVRGRYKQSNAMWTQDSEELLSEGNKELDELREILRVNSQLFYPFD